MTNLQVVWFKRDLRLRDHAPLRNAAKAGPLCLLYIHEPSMIGASDFSAQHSGFIRECLQDLDKEITDIGGTLHEMIGDAVQSLDQLYAISPFSALWSHEETGVDTTYFRDKAVAKWCREKGVAWNQIPQNGVLRGSARKISNEDFVAHLDSYISSPIVERPDQIIFSPRLFAPVVKHEIPKGVGEDKPLRLRGGRDNALSLLKEFLDTRIFDYPKSISSPLTAVEGCSRLSPHFAQGTISLREVIEAMNNRLTRDKMTWAEENKLMNSLKFYAGRLKWRTGYLQNLENRPSIDTVNMHSVMNGLREHEFNDEHFQKWKSARTGYPMVDAAMAMLKETGWINMRLRGTIISFAVNELWLHWREPMLFLAGEFLDYEPAIHWNQAQIHSGTAGTQGFLSYNPVKQAQDHDPQGQFVRQWLPALKDVPDRYIFEPWTMSESEQNRCGVIIGSDYPAPIVDHKITAKTARDRVAGAQKGKMIVQDDEHQSRIESILNRIR
jgi:deoxyribodipyrimidine photo-lyase